MKQTKYPTVWNEGKIVEYYGTMGRKPRTRRWRRTKLLSVGGPNGDHRTQHACPRDHPTNRKTAATAESCAKGIARKHIGNMAEAVTKGCPISQAESDRFRNAD